MMWFNGSSYERMICSWILSQCSYLCVGKETDIYIQLHKGPRPEKALFWTGARWLSAFGTPQAPELFTRFA